MATQRSPAASACDARYGRRSAPGDRERPGARLSSPPRGTAPHPPLAWPSAWPQGAAPADRLRTPQSRGSAPGSARRDRPVAPRAGHRRCRRACRSQPPAPDRGRMPARPASDCGWHRPADLAQPCRPSRTRPPRTGVRARRIPGLPPRAPRRCRSRRLRTAASPACYRPASPRSFKPRSASCHRSSPKVRTGRIPIRAGTPVDYGEIPTQGTTSMDASTRSLGCIGLGGRAAPSG